MVLYDSCREFKFLTKSTIETTETIVFEDGNTYPVYKIEVSAESHPFYTGKKMMLDTAGRVDAFRARLTKVDTKVLSKTEKRKLKKERKIQRELERPDTLAELRKESRKKN